MPLTRNGLTLDSVTFGGNALSAVQYNGTEVWSADPVRMISEFDITLTSSQLTVDIYFTQSEANVVTVDWGDGSPTETTSDTSVLGLVHTYA